ncbi:MBL fold metallo-hydrolase [Sphingobium sp. WW5]
MTGSTSSDDMVSMVDLTIHRSSEQIGGNCIEIACAGERLILDVGRPLDAPNDATDLLPASLDRAGHAHVLISHPHLDHYGLLEELPASWTIHSGEASAKLMRLTAGITGKVIDRDILPWRSGQPLDLGRFRVTPYLTDHSAFDAYMLLIEAAGKRILYSGDFRIHGRKSALVDRMMSSPPAAVDALLMEGTNLGSTKPTAHESDLEADFEGLFGRTKGRVFVAWSAQNVDRTVTLYRAAKKAGRTLVVDLYTAEVLEMLAEHGRLPQPGFDQLKVVITSTMSRMYKRKGMEAFVDRIAQSGHAISGRALARNAARWVVMLRGSLIADYDRSGVVPDGDDAWCWSMWRGYLESSGAPLVEWLTAGGAASCHIHTSGHASPADLLAFAKAIAPKRLVPIHSFNWDENLAGFPAICRLRDGETLSL